MRTKFVLTFVILVTALGCTFWRPGFLPPYPTPDAKDADFGNAFGSYPTTLAQNGAHTYDVSWAGLGFRGDTEPDAKPNDDVDGLFMWLSANYTASVVIIPCNRRQDAQDVYINLLVDSDRNGRWDRIPEWVVQNQIKPVGPNRACTFVFAQTRVSSIGGRFCIRSMVSDTPVVGGPNGWDGTGSWAKGEVEDVCVKPNISTPTPTPRIPTQTVTPTPTKKWIETGKTNTPSPTPTPHKRTAVTTPIVVCAGTPAYDHPNGNQIGVVKETRQGIELGRTDDGKWVHVQIHNDVGWIPVSGLAVNGQCPAATNPQPTKPPITAK